MISLKKYDYDKYIQIPWTLISIIVIDFYDTMSNCYIFHSTLKMETSAIILISLLVWLPQKL